LPEYLGSKQLNDGGLDLQYGGERPLKNDRRGLCRQEVDCGFRITGLLQGNSMLMPRPSGSRASPSSKQR
jgi:hypothetical protein